MKATEKITIEFDKEETEALMDCVAVTDKSRESGILMIPKVAEFRLNRVKLDDLWIKIFRENEKQEVRMNNTRNKQEEQRIVK